MKRSLLFLFVALGLAGTANAEFNYNLVSASYGTVDFDDLDVDGDGFGLAASFAIAENFHVFGGVDTADLDFDVDLTSWSAGMGYNTPISEKVDVIAQLSYENLEVDTPFGDADDDGFGLGVGLRVAASEKVELNGSVTYVDLSDSGDNTALGAGFLFNFTESISAGVQASFDDDVNVYSVTGRIYF